VVVANSQQIPEELWLQRVPKEGTLADNLTALKTPTRPMPPPDMALSVVLRTPSFKAPSMIGCWEYVGRRGIEQRG